MKQMERTKMWSFSWGIEEITFPPTLGLFATCKFIGWVFNTRISVVFYRDYVHCCCGMFSLSPLFSESVSCTSVIVVN